jgi:hypothetical protein
MRLSLSTVSPLAIDFSWTDAGYREQRRDTKGSRDEENGTVRKEIACGAHSNRRETSPHGCKGGISSKAFADCAVANQSKADRTNRRSKHTTASSLRNGGSQDNDEYWRCGEC